MKKPKGEITEEHLSSLAGNAKRSKQLAAYVSAIERIELQIVKLNKQKQRIYLEAAALKFCKNTIRQIAMQRVRDKDRKEKTHPLRRMYEDVVNTEKD